MKRTITKADLAVSGAKKPAVVAERLNIPSNYCSEKWKLRNFQNWLTLFLCLKQNDDRDVIVQILRLREYCQKTDEPLFEWVSENIVAAIEGEAFRLTLTEMIMTARIDSSAKQY